MATKEQNKAQSDSENQESPDAPETEQPSQQFLEGQVEEARVKLTASEAAFKEQASSGDMTAMLSAADAVKAAQRVVDKAERALEAATWEQRNEERMALSVSIKEAVEAAVSATAAEAVKLGLTGVSAVFNREDGSVQVTVNATKPAAGKTRTGGGNGTGAAKPRALWTFEGREYGSQALLAEFGGEAGALAIDKAQNPGNYDLKYSPGFDQPVKSLATKMGWGGDTNNRSLTHLPTD